MPGLLTQSAQGKWCAVQPRKPRAVHGESSLVLAAHPLSLAKKCGAQAGTRGMFTSHSVQQTPPRQHRQGLKNCSGAPRAAPSAAQLSQQLLPKPWLMDGAAFKACHTSE